MDWTPGPDCEFMGSYPGRDGLKLSMPWSGLQPDEMIQPEDCAEVVRTLLHLSPRARIPHVVIERLGEGFA